MQNRSIQRRDFVESLQGMDIRTGIKIAKFVQENEYKVSPNSLVSTVLGGIVMSDSNNPITFALEIIKTHSKTTILSDLTIISMDEYLDLLNLNIKSNEKRKSKFTNSISRR